MFPPSVATARSILQHILAGPSMKQEVRTSSTPLSPRHPGLLEAQATLDVSALAAAALTPEASDHEGDKRSLAPITAFEEELATIMAGEGQQSCPTERAVADQSFSSSLPGEPRRQLLQEFTAAVEGDTQTLPSEPTTPPTGGASFSDVTTKPVIAKLEFDASPIPHSADLRWLTPEQARRQWSSPAAVAVQAIGSPEPLTSHISEAVAAEKACAAQSSRSLAQHVEEVVGEVSAQHVLGVCSTEQFPTWSGRAHEHQAVASSQPLQHQVSAAGASEAQGELPQAPPGQGAQKVGHHAAAAGIESKGDNEVQGGGSLAYVSEDGSHLRRSKRLRAGLRTSPTLGCEAASASNEHILTPISIRRMLWRSQVPFLYDMMAIHRRVPPISSLAWVVGAGVTADGSLQQRLIAGTPESLILLAVRLPRAGLQEAEAPREREATWEAGVSRVPQAQVRLTHSMPHDGPVQRLAQSPHRQLLLATQSSRAGGEVLLFDATRWSSRESSCRPEQRLRAPSGTAPGPPEGLGKDPPGRGLAWSFGDATHLVSSLPGGVVRLWDAKAAAPVADFSGGHGGAALTALACSPGQPSTFASCGADGSVCLWDGRSPRGAGGVLRAHAHGARCAAFGRGEATQLLATGGGDGAVRLWDTRQLKEVQVLTWSPPGGPDVTPVACVEWAPFAGAALAVGTDGGQALLWDLGQGGARLPGAHAEDGPPELLFVHGGHSGEAVAAATWSAAAPWLLASCAAGGMEATTPGELHLWRPAAALAPRRQQ